MSNQTAQIADNRYVAELFGIMRENGRDTDGLSALLNHVGDMENFVKQAESTIADMKTQLDDMREVQNHPVKSALRSAIKALESTVSAMKLQISELKSSIVEGCKNAVTAFKEHGIASFDKLASFFRVKDGLLSMKNSIVAGVSECDRALSRIDSFANEYHSIGRHLKNMGRILIGKPPIDTKKEAGKLARAVGAPYRAHKSCLFAVKKAVNESLGRLERLEQSADTIRSERAAERKPRARLAERLEAGMEKVRQRDNEMKAPERAPTIQGAEI